MFYHAIYFGIVGACIGWGVALLAILFIKHSMKRESLTPLIQRIILRPATLEKIVDMIPLEEEASFLIDEKLELLTESFKMEHPMMGLFLTPEIVEPLKKRARRELLDAIPALKKSIIEKAREKARDEKFSESLGGMLEGTAKELSLLKSFSCKLQACGAAVGLFFALTSAFLIF